MNKNKKINNIFLKRTNIDFEKESQLRECHFFGITLNIPPREIALVVLDIERELNIVIPEQCLKSKEFCSYQQVLNILQTLQSEKEETL